MNYDLYESRPGAQRFFGGSGPKAPQQPPPAPAQEDPAIQQAAANAKTAALKRRGRKASILTGTTDAGAESGTGTLLGGT